MTKMTTQALNLNGITPAFTAVTASDTFDNDGRTYLHVKNGSASSINVTVNAAVLCNHGFDHDVVVAVPASAERIIGPLDPSRFNDPTTGLVGVTYSATTTVTAAVFKL